MVKVWARVAEAALQGLGWDEQEGFPGKGTSCASHGSKRTWVFTEAPLGVGDRAGT